MPVKIVFLKLNTDNRERIICDLVEKFYIAGKRVIVSVRDEKEGIRLDNLLWSWKQHSFIPHVFEPELKEPLTEPVVLTNSVAADCGYDTLILSNPMQIDTLKNFSFVIDFAEQYDKNLLEKSRQRFKEYRANNLEQEAILPGQFFSGEL